MKTINLPEDYQKITALEPGDKVIYRGLEFDVGSHPDDKIKLYFHTKYMGTDNPLVDATTSRKAHLTLRDDVPPNSYIRFKVKSEYFNGDYSEYALFTVDEWVDMFKKRPQDAKIW